MFLCDNYEPTLFFIASNLLGEMVLFNCNHMIFSAKHENIIEFYVFICLFDEIADNNRYNQR